MVRVKFQAFKIDSTHNINALLTLFSDPKLASEILAKAMQEHNTNTVPKKSPTDRHQRQLYDDFLHEGVEQYVSDNLEPDDQQEPESDEGQEDVDEPKKKKSRK